MDDHLYEDNYAFETYANGVCIVSDAPGMRTGGTLTNPWFVQAEDKRVLPSQFRSVYAPVPSFPTDPLRPWDRPRPSMIRTSWRPLSSHVAHSTQGIVTSVGPPQNQFEPHRLAVVLACLRPPSSHTHGQRLGRERGGAANIGLQQNMAVNSSTCLFMPKYPYPCRRQRPGTQVNTFRSIQQSRCAT